MEYIAIPILAGLCIWWLMRVSARNRKEREVNRELVLRIIEMSEHIKHLELTRAQDPVIEASEAPSQHESKWLESEYSASSARDIGSEAAVRGETRGSFREVSLDADSHGLVSEAHATSVYEKVGLAMVVVASALSIAARIRNKRKS